MNRLKFLVFALIVLALWAFHLTRLSPALSSRAADLAAGRAMAAAPLVGEKLAADKALAVNAAALASQNPALLSNLIPARTSKPEPISPEKYTALRDAVLASVNEAARANAVVAVITETAGNVASKGTEAAVTEGPDFAAIAKAGTAGATVKVFDADYVFHSFPVMTLDKQEVKTLATVAVGLPVSKPDLAAIARELELTSIALVEGDKVVASSGSNSAEKAAGTMKAGDTAVVDRGSISALGPVKLPILTSEDPMGGRAPLAVAARKTLAGTGYDVVAIASVAPVLEPLASYQRFALLGFAILLGLTLLWLVIMGSSRPKDEGRAMVMPDPNATIKAPTTTIPSAAIPPAEANGSSLSMPEMPPAPEADPDDFEFPNSVPSGPSSAAAAPPPTADEEPMAPPPPPSSAFPFDSAEGPEETTRAYSAASPDGDPFGAVGGMAATEPPPPPEAEGDFNPEATRVAMIPTELLQQAQRQEPKAPPASARNSPGLASTRPFPALSGNPDEGHWQEVYKDFVATRERCGEPADGLTYEKFKVKLQKNKDQLVQKYNCRTVKFQVYVKEGKAALKATPVKE